MFDTLDINDVIAPVYAGGPYFMNPGISSADYAVNSNPKVIYSCSPWVVGLNEQGNLHVSAETFRAPCNPLGDSCNSLDYWSGPMANIYDTEYDNKYYKIWKLDQSEIDYHLINYSNTGYVAPDDILTWPGNGDVNNGEPAQLAPYYDMNNNGVYDPLEGDAPMIKGDQALYMITTDARQENTFSDGEILGIDLHYTFYTISCPGLEIPQVNETTFASIRVVNRSSNDYHDLHIGNWTDFDIGSPFNDFIGTSVEQNLQYAYNAYQLDEASSASEGFGYNPAACGIMYLNHQLAYSMTYNNGNNPFNGEPSEPIHYYNYIKSIFKDGSLFFDENDEPTKFVYHDSPTNPTGWSEYTYGNPPGDRRGISSVGPFELASGGELEVDFAIVYAHGDYTASDIDSHILNAEDLIYNAEQVQLYYDGQTSCSTIGTEENDKGSFNIYPNPGNSFININSEKGGIVDVFDARGKLIFSQNSFNNRLTLDVSTFENGVYFIRMGNSTRQFIKE